MKNLITIILLSITALTATAQWGRGRDKDKDVPASYTEDLSKVRPTYSVNLDSLLISDTILEERKAVVVQHDQNAELVEVFDSLTMMNKNIRFVQGYKVLVYSGNSQEDALTVRREVMDILRDNGLDRKKDEVQFHYHQPVFRIKVGYYTSRLEATRTAEFLKKQKFDFGEDSPIRVNPLVVPDKIEIRD